MGRKINLGCGGYRLAGFENVDIVARDPLDGWPDLQVIIADARTYDCTGAETVFAGHFYEHLTEEDGRAFLRRIRAQAPDAELVLTVPAIDRCGDPSVDRATFMQMIGVRPPDKAPDVVWHLSWYRARDLRKELLDAGYNRVEEWPDCPWLVSRASWQVTFRASNG